MELAREMVDACHRCGSHDISIRKVEVKSVACGFLWSNRKEILRVYIDCADCHACIGETTWTDLDVSTIELHLNMQKARRKRRREVFGID